MAAMNAGGRFTHRFSLTAHGSTKIDVVYMNETSVVRSNLDMFDHWLLANNHKFVGLDLEYTKDGKEVAIFQLSMRQHVLVFQYCR